MRLSKLTAIGISALALAIAACSAEQAPGTLTLIAHDSFADGVTEDTFAAFTEETGIRVEVLAAGDAGSMVNQAVLSKGNPLADVLFGVDDTYLSRALDEEIFRVYRSTEVDKVHPELVDTQYRVTPIDYGDVCINYDTAWFESTSIAVPERLESLRAELYASHLSVEHPATSSPGLAFMFATIAEFGEEGWLDFWADLRDGGVRVASDWTTAYYTDFLTHGGPSSMVVSYASSPPAEVVFSEEPIDSPPTGVIEAGCYRQVEYAGILAGTQYPAAAGKLIDFMLSLEFQEQIPLSWFVFPANQDAQLPSVFAEHVVIPDDPARLSPAYIAENRDRWIDEWIQVMEG
ncbi:MAG: thiamine ABC transporter substrate-binding protein [Acidimicrobiia bacterium]|nr:thiamine ABC transporter substrate-binding protein [Acidimicrobiia bacterium]